MLEISKVGNPILKQIAPPIDHKDLKDLQPLIESLIATTVAANGVGIAAPQVGESLRLFIVASRPTPRYPHAPLMEPTAMINPTIISHSEEVVKDWEGCLSVPGLRGLVPRFNTIEIEYTKIDGCVTRMFLSDFVARIFQHELDHLNGILFIDRIESKEDLFSEEEYQAIINRLQATAVLQATGKR